MMNILHPPDVFVYDLGSIDRSYLQGRLRFVYPGYFLTADISNPARKRILIILNHDRRSVFLRRNQLFKHRGFGRFQEV
jgi:hypothetical protein